MMDIFFTVTGTMTTVCMCVSVCVLLPSLSSRENIVKTLIRDPYFRVAAWTKGHG